MKLEKAIIKLRFVHYRFYEVADIYKKYLKYTNTSSIKYQCVQYLLYWIIDDLKGNVIFYIHENSSIHYLLFTLLLLYYSYKFFF